MALKVAMIAPPWISIPPNGYGGIELVLETLIKGLQKNGVKVTLFSNGKSKIRGVKTKYLFEADMFPHIHKPWYEALPIIQAHIHFALNKIQKEGDYDIIHDHNPLFSPQLLAIATQLKNMPPALHTFHGPPFSDEATIKSGVPDNRLLLKQLKQPGNLYFVCISKAMRRNAPTELNKYLLKPVHNAIKVSDFMFKAKKKKYFITLARFFPDKGQHIAAKYCAKLGRTLKMAGTVAGIGSPRKLLLELANPSSKYRRMGEFKYYSDHVLPYTLNYRKIAYVGNLSGSKKINFIANAKALLFPITWEEPFGMAVIEALACGTPVIAMDRGAMSEIIEHGVNGFLAKTEKEFEAYINRIDEIDPYECRRTVEEKFSTDAMVQNYINRYQEIIARTRE